MNKSNLTVALIFAATTFSAAHASDGTITFTGRIVDNTCTISNPSGSDFAVNLPSVSRNTLSESGSVAGRTPFTINLSNCSSGNVSTYFESGSTVDFDTGRLVNQTSPESNVQLQLSNSNGEVIALHQPQENSQKVLLQEGEESAQLHYYAEYYSTGSAKPGEFFSTLNYTIKYN
ncbi:fimbrial protein [Pseudoalteromonas lipolytica]|uniref:Fimbrial protein n=1 Tax=Pseudoalteromonas lipolytica TaxID=570156 RepID=A0ABU8SZ13_9GAMM